MLVFISFYIGTEVIIWAGVPLETCEDHVVNCLEHFLQNVQFKYLDIFLT